MTAVIIQFPLARRLQQTGYASRNQLRIVRDIQKRSEYIPDYSTDTVRKRAFDYALDVVKKYNPFPINAFNNGGDAA